MRELLKVLYILILDTPQNWYSYHRCIFVALCWCMYQLIKSVCKDSQILYESTQNKQQYGTEVTCTEAWYGKKKVMVSSEI